MDTETKRLLPDSYAEALIAHWNLGKVRKTISAECAVAIVAEDRVHVMVLTQADDDIAAAQRLLSRAAARIHTHHESHYNFPP